MQHFSSRPKKHLGSQGLEIEGGCLDLDSIFALRGEMGIIKYIT